MEFNLGYRPDTETKKERGRKTDRYMRNDGKRGRGSIKPDQVNVTNNTA